MGRALSVFAASTLLLLALPVMVAASLSAQHQAAASPAALAEIPPAMLALYRGAVEVGCPSLPWSVLAAVGKVESDHGRVSGATVLDGRRILPPIIGPPLDGSAATRRILDTDAGTWDGDEVFDRAVGPMQFIPDTWRSVGVDGSGDGLADPHNAADAVHSAAVYLCGLGATDPDNIADALFSYNNSSTYVREVLDLADRYTTATSLVGIDEEMLIALILTNPRINIYSAGRTDIAEGRIDARVLLALQRASAQYDLHVSSLQSGHSRCVGGGNYDGCNVSHHWHGRAVDISRVDGQPVRASNGAAKELAHWFGNLVPPLAPYSVGSPWPSLQPTRRHFSDQAHQDHLHIGWAVS